MKKIFVAGHQGMVGSAVCRRLESFTNVQIVKLPRAELDLCNQEDVFRFIKKEKPDEVIIAAAKVGGIHANFSYPAEFIYENLQIQTNIIHASHINDVNKLMFLGSSCIYPKFSKQPIKEPELLSGWLEPTNEPYAIAKIAGIKMCESYNRQYGRDYRSIMPTNLYGIGDNYHPENSHVVPALIRRFHEAKINNEKCVTIWGTGKPKRDLLYVDDMADACLYLMNLEQSIYTRNTHPSCSHINIGSGEEISIIQLATLIKEIVQFEGKIKCDSSKPDGVQRKKLDVTLAHRLGWQKKISLRNGLRNTYADFIDRNA